MDISLGFLKGPFWFRVLGFILGFRGYIRVVLGFYRDTGEFNGNCYLGPARLETRWFNASSKHSESPKA